MPINTRGSYIEIGTSVNDDYSLNNVLRLPAPIELPSSNEFLAEAERSADATMTIQQIGRTQYTTQVRFGALKNTKWWEINRWFDTFGYVFYMKYFSHTEGRVKIHRFYRGNIDKGAPSTKTEVIDGYTVPQKYIGCGFSIIDMGEFDVVTVHEMAVE